MYRKQGLVAAWLAVLVLAGCTRTVEPDEPVVPVAPAHDGSLRVAALDYQVGDLSDPAELAKYARAELLIVQLDQFWGRQSTEGRLAPLRAANPDLKIIGYFRSKAVREAWGDYPRESQTYNYDLYQASLPYWSYTTTGDTLSDWPGAVVFDFTNAAARQAMLQVFAHYQYTSSNRFDGVFWDYFSRQLWISPQVTGMTGEPDLDGDGVSHFQDEDELARFLAAQEAWIAEFEAEFGRGFIQIANGARTAVDSTFVSRLDGMFYEIFPDVGFVGASKFAQALDPACFNNLWAAHSWPRRTNGGPWLILSHAPRVGSYYDENGVLQPIDTGDINRAVALLTGATVVHYDGSGDFRAGIPDVELDLGRPLGSVTIDGTRFERRFENGRIVLDMMSGSYPAPFAYSIEQGGHPVDVLAYRE